MRGRLNHIAAIRKLNLEGETDFKLNSDKASEHTFLRRLHKLSVTHLSVVLELPLIRFSLLLWSDRNVTSDAVEARQALLTTKILMG